ncbi:hypothetical protein Bca4012_025615 [Brassica carinata]|uniref:Uncharacterized protein n=1 Tax=Brassica carinata TaxID=52824 RepID=A0A8X7VH81_BRACI|nr:hypothetical protein Bca52824_022719 [Brassica carinata]
MFESFKELKPENLLDQKRFQTDNNHLSGHVLSLDHFMKHSKSFDHYEKVLELDLKQSDFCFKPCDLFARSKDKSFVVNFPRHELVTDDCFAYTYLLKEPRKLHEPKLHQSDIRFEFVKSEKFSEFEIDCLCAENYSKRVELFFKDILVYNTFFDKPTAQLNLELIDSECVNLFHADIWVCNTFFDMHNRWRNHTVLCFGEILVYNNIFDMITHLICTKQAEKGTGEKRGNTDQSVKDVSMAKLEMQQSNLGNCLAASFDRRAVRGSYLNNQSEFCNKTNCIGNLTHQSLTSILNHIQSFSGERVVGSTNRVILSLLCLNFSEFRTSQSYLWRPGEHSKVSDYVFKSSLIDNTDMMHLFLSKEPCADYKEAWKHTRIKNKHEEDKRFKHPDLNQERHQGITCFVLIKEAPPDAAYKPKPSRNKFGIRLFLFDKFSCANLLCFNVLGLSNESGIKWINAFYISEPVRNNSHCRSKNLQ